MKTLNHLRTLRRARNLTLQSLADKVGTSKSQIDKLEKGERRLTLEWMRKLAGGLDCEIEEIYSGLEKSISDTRKTIDVLSGQIIERYSRTADLPVIGFFNSPRGDKLDKSQIVEVVPRPGNLASVKNAFALYASEEDMAPRFAPGELLFINPNKPLTRGCFVVIELKGGQTIIKQFVKQTKTHVMLKQFSPAKEIRLKNSEISNLFRIVGSAETAG